MAELIGFPDRSPLGVDVGWLKNGVLGKLPQAYPSNYEVTDEATFQASSKGKAISKLHVKVRSCILHNVPKTGKSLLKLKNQEALVPGNVPFQVHLLAQAMTRALQQEVLSAHDLTPLHWGILCCLWRTDGLRTTEIAQCLDQLGGTITMGLDTMQKRELITRTTDELDRRILRVFLTHHGRSLESVVLPKAARLIERMMRHQSHAEYEAFLKDLLKIREGVNAISRS